MAATSDNGTTGAPSQPDIHCLNQISNVISNGYLLGFLTIQSGWCPPNFNLQTKTEKCYPLLTVGSTLINRPTTKPSSI